MLRFTPALAVFAVVLLDAAFARAERPRRPSVRLEYERKKGAARCPDEASLRAHVAAQLGRDPFTPEGSWRVVASVARRGAGFVANMEAFENDGKTWSPGPITDPSCARLVNEILALSIATTPTGAACSPWESSGPVTRAVRPPIQAPHTLRAPYMPRRAGASVWSSPSCRASPCISRATSWPRSTRSRSGATSTTSGKRPPSPAFPRAGSLLIFEPAVDFKRDRLSSTEVWAVDLPTFEDLYREHYRLAWYAIRKSGVRRPAVIEELVQATTTPGDPPLRHRRLAAPSRRAQAACGHERLRLGARAEDDPRAEGHRGRFAARTGRSAGEAAMA